MPSEILTRGFEFPPPGSYIHESYPTSEDQIYAASDDHQIYTEQDSLQVYPDQDHQNQQDYTHIDYEAGKEAHEDSLRRRLTAVAVTFTMVEALYLTFLTGIIPPPAIPLINNFIVNVPVKRRKKRQVAGGGSGGISSFLQSLLTPEASTNNLMRSLLKTYNGELFQLSDLVEVSYFQY